MDSTLLFLSLLILLNCFFHQGSEAGGPEFIFAIEDTSVDLYDLSKSASGSSEGGAPLSPQMLGAFQMLESARSELQKLHILKSRLRAILEAYEQDMNQQGLRDEVLLTSRFSTLIQKQFGGASLPPRKAVLYEVSQPRSERFQVDGIEPERLAVNNGDQIIFNASGLAKRKLTLSSLTQLWLHEISHWDPQTPLEIRDAWAARVASWLRDRTVVVPFRKGQIISFLLPAPGRLPSINFPTRPWDPSFREVFLEQLRKNTFIVYEEANDTRVFDEIFEAFRTSNDVLDFKSELSIPPLLKGRISWPRIEIKTLRAGPKGQLLVSYMQSSYGIYTYIGSSSNQTPVLVLEPREGFQSPAPEEILKPDLPDVEYRFEISQHPEGVSPHRSTRRNFTVPTQSADFKLLRITSYQNKRFVSLKLNTPNNSLSREQLKGIHIMAKDRSNNQSLTLVTAKGRILNPQEVLIRAEIPFCELEISQIRVPQVSKDGFYSELLIRPSLPLLIEGRPEVRPSDFRILSMNHEERIEATERTKGVIRFLTNKEVSGLTLSLQHLVQTRSVGFTRGIVSTNPNNAGSPQNLDSLALGRKYFISIKNMIIARDQDRVELKFDFPEDQISQHRESLMETRVVTHFYKATRPLRATTIYDLNIRRIENIWIHFKDGSIESVPYSMLPESINLKGREGRDRKGWEGLSPALQTTSKKCQALLTF